MEVFRRILSDRDLGASGLTVVKPFLLMLQRQMGVEHRRQSKRHPGVSLLIPACDTAINRLFYFHLCHTNRDPPRIEHVFKGVFFEWRVAVNAQAGQTVQFSWSQERPRLLYVRVLTPEELELIEVAEIMAGDFHGVPRDKGQRSPRVPKVGFERQAYLGLVGQAAGGQPLPQNQEGQMRVHSGGFKVGGGRAVELDKGDIPGISWMKVPRTNQLGVRSKDSLYYKFIRDQDVSSLTNFLRSSFGFTPDEKQLSVTGHNWGEVDFNGNMLTFLSGSKQALELSLADVSQTLMQGKNDFVLQFYVVDTTGANERGSVTAFSFHIPNSDNQFFGDENRPLAQVCHGKIMSMADVDAEEAVVTFDGTAILTQRGRYIVELHFSFSRLQGQANDCKIQYSSCLPKGIIHDVFTNILRALSSAKVTKPGKFRSCQDGYAAKSSLIVEDSVLYHLSRAFSSCPSLQLLFFMRRSIMWSL